MSNKSLFEIKGFDNLQRIFKTLPDKVKRKEMLKILGQVANPTLKAARSLAPVSLKPHTQSGKRTKKTIDPGNLKKSLGKIRGKRGYAKENAVLYVGPRTGKRKKYDGWYTHFVEHGTTKIKGQHFMKKAEQQTEARITEDAEKRVEKYIQKQIDRLTK